MKKKILIPTLSLFLICMVASLLLGFADGITKEKIEQNNIIAEQESRKKVISAESFSDKIEDTFTLSDGSKVSYNYVKALDKSGNVTGVVFVTPSTGYGGAISIMTGVDLDGKVTGIEFLEINETVGLGMNAKKDSFKDQFKNLFKGITVTKSDTRGDNEIKALTGATITSKAVTKGVNTALEIYDSKIEAEVKGNG